MFRDQRLNSVALLGRLSALLVVLCFAAHTAIAAPDSPTVPDLKGVSHQPLANHGQKADLFLFVTTDCPIVNAYAAEMERICAAYKHKGIECYLVYTDSSQSAEAARHHARAFKLHTATPLRDIKHVLVKRFGAEITPQAAVVTPDGQCVYLGRIDDRFVDFGKGRYRPTTHELRDALTAVLAGHRPAAAAGRAIGCYISNN